MVRVKKMRVMSLLLAVLFILAACSGGNTNDSKNGNASKETQTSTEATELSFFMNTNIDAKAVKGFEEIRAYQEIQKRTNTKIQFQTPGDGTQFNIMLASGDYPDIMYVPNNYPGGVAKLVEDGVAIRLNELIEEHAPHYKKLLEDYPEIRRQIVLDDGTIAKFPQIDIDMRRIAYSGHMVREDWLNQLGLEPPTTLEEWHKVLTAFKENDLNGNGVADEIPLGERGDSLGSLSSFAPSFGILADRFMINPDSGKVTYGPIEPAYKDYITLMNQWYSEGLIDPEFAATDRTAFNTKFANNVIGAYGAVISGINSFKDIMAAEIPDFKLIGLRPPIGPAGVSYSGHGQMVQSVPLDGAVISSQAKDPVAAIKLLDFMISEEGSDLQNWGIEGESYEIVDGQKRFSDIIWNDPDGLEPSEAIKRYALPTSGMVKVMSFDAWAAFALKYEEAVEANQLWYEADRSLLLPPLTFTGEESQIIGRVLSEVETYMKEMWLKFVMGAEPIEQYDKFVQTLKDMGIEEAIAVYQAAYDRYQSR